MVANSQEGRTRRSRVGANRLTISLAAMLLAVSLTSCATTRTVSLAQLVAGQDQLVGVSLQTSGTVQEIVDPDGTRYFILANDAGDRVALMPAKSVSDDVGQAIVVTGTLENVNGFGRVLTVESVRPAR